MVWNQSPSVQVSCLMTKCHLISRKKTLDGALDSNTSGAAKYLVHRASLKIPLAAIGWQLLHLVHIVHPAICVCNVGLAAPKSEISAAIGSRCTKTLLGLRSRCMMCKPCRCGKPSIRHPASTFALGTRTVVLLMQLCKSVS